MKKLNADSFIFSMEKFLDAHKLPAWGITAAVLVLLPFGGLSAYIMRIFIMIGIYAMLGIGLNLLAGYTGQVSFGHAGFFAIGAYTTALLMIRLNLNFFPALLIGSAFTGLCGLLLGIPTLRLSGDYLTIVTLGFGEIIKMIITNWESMTNGTLGLNGIPAPSFFGLQLTLENHGIYYLMLVLLTLVSIATVMIIKSNTGRAFLAIREDEMAAVMMGIKTTKFKALSFAISALITGIAGGLYAALVGYIDANSFTFDVSTLIITIVIVGGMGTMRGMFLGAAVLISFPEVARFLADYRFVVYGVVLVLMMRFRPQGLLGWKSQMPYKMPKLATAALAKRSGESLKKGEPA